MASPPLPPSSTPSNNEDDHQQHETINSMQINRILDEAKSIDNCNGTIIQQQHLALDHNSEKDFSTCSPLTSSGSSGNIIDNPSQHINNQHSSTNMPRKAKCPSDQTTSPSNLNWDQKQSLPSNNNQSAISNETNNNSMMISKAIQISPIHQQYLFPKRSLPDDQQQQQQQSSTNKRIRTSATTSNTNHNDNSIHKNTSDIITPSMSPFQQQQQRPLPPVQEVLQQIGHEQPQHSSSSTMMVANYSVCLSIVFVSDRIKRFD